MSKSQAGFKTTKHLGGVTKPNNLVFNMVHEDESQFMSGKYKAVN